MPPAPESVTATLNNHLENQYGYAVVTVDGNQVSITYYAGWPAGSGVPTTWYPFETFGYTVASKTLGLRDVNQTIPPRILTQFYPGIAINKVGAGDLTLGAGASNYSEPITVSAGNLSVYGDYANVPVSINYGAQATLRGGSINDVTVAVGGNLVGPGTVGNVTNDGYLCPDLINGPWSLNVIGNYVQTASGHFNVDAASTSNYGQMLVKGAAVLSGALIVTMQNGFAPSVGTILSNVITAEGGITGTFSQVTAGGLPPDLGVIALYTGNSVRLQVVSASD
jgi:autotransporter-associated beta strand protein